MCRNTIASWQLVRPYFGLLTPCFYDLEKSRRAVLLDRLEQPIYDNRISRLQSMAAAYPTNRLSFLFLLIGTGSLASSIVLLGHNDMKLAAYGLMAIAGIWFVTLGLERWLLPRRRKTFRIKMEELLSTFNQYELSQASLKWELSYDEKVPICVVKISESTETIAIDDEAVEPLPPYCVMEAVRVSKVSLLVSLPLLMLEVIEESGTLASWKLVCKSFTLKKPYFDIGSEESTLILTKLGQVALRERIDRLQALAKTCPTDRPTLVLLTAGSVLTLAAGIVATNAKLRIALYVLLSIAFIFFLVLGVERLKLPLRNKKFKEKLELVLITFEELDYPIRLKWCLEYISKEQAYYIRVLESDAEEHLPRYCLTVETSEEPPDYTP
ncbi:uncharacterized protein VTP21DRAFT_9486 [Calcarisporiella thermophila]|uniref:uncharacterized protein n=1 Tax=Calcarisporiella thermophila TaxID=911321 RepID=UPI003741EBC5